jgi:hypothetical protein
LLYSKAPSRSRQEIAAGGGAVGTRSVCWIAPAPTTPPQSREFLQTVIFAPYLDHLPQQLHDAFLDATIEELGEPIVLDYQRLNWDAIAR